MYICSTCCLEYSTYVHLSILMEINFYIIIHNDFETHTMLVFL